MRSNPNLRFADVACLRTDPNCREESQNRSNYPTVHIRPHNGRDRIDYVASIRWRKSADHHLFGFDALDMNFTMPPGASKKIGHEGGEGTCSGKRRDRR